MPDPKTAAVVETTIQPYTLKPSGDTLSRDVLATWKEVQLSHMRQNEYWKQFLPGGTNAEWKASDDAVQIREAFKNKNDEAYGIFPMLVDPPPANIWKILS